MVEPEFARLVQILSLAEEASATGASRVEFRSGEAEVVGQLVAENGRICWATARSQPERIGDIFAEECGVSREVLEEVFHDARESGRPFGEVLVQRGMVKDEDMQRCLRRQTIGAVLAIWRGWSGDSPLLHEMAESLYDPAFTVGSLELLGLCLDQLPAGIVPGPTESLRQLADRCASAVCFRRQPRDESPLAPIVWSGVDALTLQDMQLLARNSLAVAEPVTLTAASIHPRAILVHSDGAGVICALDGPDLWVFEVSERAQYGQVMAQVQALARADADGSRRTHLELVSSSEGGCE